MKIGIPVKCQNGHKAIWIVEFSGLDTIHRGVHPNDKCKCPKHDIGMGYFADGQPFLSNADAASDVLAERLRQVQVEGWTPQHDDAQAFGELSNAACCYAIGFEGCPVPSFWPWAPDWWKPRTQRENLVRAGALILAEIERIDRQAAKAVQL